MTAAPSIEALRSALEPVEALRGEQSQLESWVLESFASLEALQSELAEWQRDMTRQQAALDQREAAVADVQALASNDAADAELADCLRTATAAVGQLEAENAEQLQAIDDLDRQLTAAHAELRGMRQRVDDLTDALESERNRSTDEHRHWTAELKEMRRLLARQGDMLAALAGTDAGQEATRHDEAPSVDRDGSATAHADSDLAARTAEFHRRANVRRAAQRRPA